MKIGSNLNGTPLMNEVEVTVISIAKLLLGKSSEENRMIRDTI